MARSALSLPRRRPHAPASVALRSLSLHAEPVARWAELLVPAETARASRFVRAEDRDRHILGRGLIRQMLGDALGRDPRTLRFTTGSNGRPELDVPGAPSFNVSHSGDRILAAVSSGCRIGVDVERHDPQRDLRAIARRVYTTAECAALAEETGFERAFFRQWTRKEAVLKALGTAFSLDPLAFSVIDRRGELRIEPESGWRGDGAEAGIVRDLDVGPAFSAALVILP